MEHAGSDDGMQHDMDSESEEDEEVGGAVGGRDYDEEDFGYDDEDDDDGLFDPTLEDAMFGEDIDPNKR